MFVCMYERNEIIERLLIDQDEMINESHKLCGNKCTLVHFAYKYWTEKHSTVANNWQI